MKKLLVVLIVFITQNVFCQAGGSQTIKGNQTGSIKYIPINSFNTNNRINISNIGDYIQFINEKKVDIVFLSDNTFVCEFNSVLYTIPTNGYKTLNDFSEGQNKNFNDGPSYYLAIEQKLTSQNDVDIYRQDLGKANTLGFISILDYRDALNSGFLSMENRRNFQTVSGILSKNDLQGSIYYLNILLGLSDKNSNDVINNPALYNNNGVRLYGNSYYYITLAVNNRYGNSQNLNDSSFYYACKLAKYDTAEDFLTNNNFNNSNNYGVINIKTTETIYKELHYETYNDFIAAIHGTFLNYSDYYLAKKYNIDSNSILSTNRNIINDIERIKQNYKTDNNNYALSIYYILKRQKGIPVSVDVFAREINEDYNRNNWRLINIYPIDFDTVYTNVETMRSIVVYDQTGRSFYLK